MTGSSPHVGERSKASRGAASTSRVVAAGERVETAEDQGNVPSRFAVCAAAVVKLPGPGFKIQQMGPTRIVTATGGSPENVPRQRLAYGGFGGPCVAVTTNEARSLAKALDGAGPAKEEDGLVLSYRFNAPNPSRQVWIAFEPYLPHGETTCSPCG